MKKNINKILLLILVTSSLTSCLIDDDSLTKTFDDGSNFANFANFNQTISAVADGNDVVANSTILLEGPNMVGYTDDVSVTVSVDPSSTAIEGTHYRLDAPLTVQLLESENYIVNLPITIITEGISPPLDVNPEIVLAISTANGNNVVASSKTSKLTIVYQCFADLSGTYLVTNDGCNLNPFLTTITKNADGSWFIAIGDGGFLGYGCTGNPGLNNYANIVELCGEILPTDDLEYGPCCDIGNIQGGTWDPENGILTMNHTQDFTGNWPGSWTSTYTRQ